MQLLPYPPLDGWRVLLRATAHSGSMEQVSNCIREALSAGHIDTMQVQMLDANLTGFSDYIGASERLLKTPVPFGLVLHLRWVMIFYILTVPFYLAGPGGIGWGAVPVTIIFAYSLTGLVCRAETHSMASPS